MPAEPAALPPAPRHRFSSALSRVAREPLVQFLIIGAVLFAAHGVIHGPEQHAASSSIRISEGRVQQLAESYRLLSGRMPSRAELHTLVDDYVDEEIDYREAVAMGLDVDDTIVRRRMRQKLEFLTENGDASQEPDERQLAAWLRSHAAEYRIPERISLRHVLASRDERGSRAPEDLEKMLTALRRGATPESLGDASMLPSALPLTTERGVAELFGDEFAASVFTQTHTGWFGPVASPLGVHAVLILSRELAREPGLAEVRDKVRSDWIEARRFARRQDLQARLRKRYEVRIDWPEPYASQTALATAPLSRPLNSATSE